jgi:hypothetical protein
MTLDRDRLIARLKRATDGHTHQQIADKVAAHPMSGCKPLRPHVSAALAGKDNYDYLLVAMATTFLTGNWAVRKIIEYTNDTYLPEEEEVAA